MQKDALNNIHIVDEQVLITPEQLKQEFPLSQNKKSKSPTLVRLFLTLFPGVILGC